MMMMMMMMMMTATTIDQEYQQSSNRGIAGIASSTSRLQHWKRILLFSYVATNRIRLRI